MKTITISLDDQVYQAASAEAAKRRKSLGDLGREVFATWFGGQATADKTAAGEGFTMEELREQAGCRPVPSELKARVKAQLESLGIKTETVKLTGEKLMEARALAELYAMTERRHAGHTGSAGPLNREELYQRGIPGY